MFGPASTLAATHFARKNRRATIGPRRTAIECYDAFIAAHSLEKDLMSNSMLAITNLLYGYAEAFDAGDLERAAKLFRHARIKVRDRVELLDEIGLLALWREHVKIYPCGTPRTKHVVTNPIIEIDESAGKASARSCYTVYQATENFPLQLIATGRYHDQFERVDGIWRFAHRDYSLLDMIGDMSFHLNVPVTADAKGS